jgi:cytoskeletal protein CcmA (bactofilin family)
MSKKDEVKVIAFLGNNTEFEGKLTFNDAVRIDGTFKGEIESEGMLIVGETAMLHSEIRVSHIIISGEIHGNIVAGTRIEIHAPGKVYGNIQAPVVVMEQGAIFEGNCRMEKGGQHSL